MTTDTPGSTLPWASLTTPEIDAVDCAAAPQGTMAVNRATMTATFQRLDERNILPPPAPRWMPPKLVLLQPCHLQLTPGVEV